MNSDPSRGDRYLPAGTKVRLDSCTNEKREVEPEYGVVVHCWKDAEIYGYDCYVAFFGGEMPTGKPDERPYVLRYAATSLTTIT